MSDLIDLAGAAWPVVLILIGIISSLVSAANKSTGAKKPITPVKQATVKKPTKSKSVTKKPAAQQRKTPKKAAIQTTTRKQEQLLRDIRQESNIHATTKNDTANRPHSFRGKTASSSKLKEAIILKEVLEKPVSLRK